MIHANEALSRGTRTDRETVFNPFALWSWQLSHGRSMHVEYAGVHQVTRRACVMQYFSRIRRLPWRESAAFPRTYPSPSTRKATLFFFSLSLSLFFNFLLRHEWKEVKWKSKDFLLSLLRGTKQRHDLPSLRNLTNFRSTSTSTSFSRETASMQNGRRQTRRRTLLRCF